MKFSINLNTLKNFIIWEKTIKMNISQRKLQSLCLICSCDDCINSSSCECNICSSCLYHWTMNQTKDFFLKGDDKVRCPNLTCSKMYKIIDILPLFEPNQVQEINTLMLKNYARETVDIITCRNVQCEYYGYMQDLNCHRQLICDSCDHRWKEKSMLTPLEKIYFYLNNSTLFVDEVKSELYEAIFTIYCPSCGIPIRKSGGCNHMTCKKCAFEFCWICRFKYNGHSDDRCNVNIMTKILIAGFILFHLGWLLDLYGLVWYAIVYVIRFILKVAFLNFTFVIILILIFPILCICKERESIFDDKKKLIGYTVAFSVMVCITWWDFCYIMNHYGKECIYLILGEGGIISLISMIDFFTHTWYKYVQ